MCQGTAAPGLAGDAVFKSCNMHCRLYKLQDASRCVDIDLGQEGHAPA